jgi:hypothetical protein
MSMNANGDYETPPGTHAGISASGFSNIRRSVTPGSFVRGNSGCDVRIVSELDKVIVRKSSTSIKYNHRLKMQVDKQRHCLERNGIPSVRIPRILSEAEVDGFYVADMEYVYFHNSIDFFSSASRPALDSVFAAVAKFVDEEIESSKVVEVPMKIFRDKVEEIAKAIQSVESESIFDNSLSRIRCAMDRKPKLMMPVGPCHGDLTFSNIMIASDASAIALIDFLDSFIESPLMDIAKLRQDTLFNWTLLMSDHVQDRIRFRQIMSYIDRNLDDKFNEKYWYRQNIDLILAVNMLRIAPYSRSEKVRDFIITAIDSLRFDHD